MRISVAISTLGRASLEPLLESLLAQEKRPHQISVADQGTDSTVESITAKFRDRLNIRVTKTARGLALGRNLAARGLAECDAIFFTDDDCVLAPNALRLAASSVSAQSDVVTGRIFSTLGDRGQVSVGERITLDRHSLWQLGMEGNMTFARPAFEMLGGFDEDLGIGAPTPWQSGEGTELMIRALNAGMSVVHDPSIIVYEKAPVVSLRELSAKTLSYARGTGRVYALHYTLSQHLAVSCRPAAGAVLRLAQGRFREAWLLLHASAGRLSALSSRRDKPSSTQ